MGRIVMLDDDPLATEWTSLLLGNIYHLLLCPDLLFAGTSLPVLREPRLAATK